MYIGNLLHLHPLFRVCVRIILDFFRNREFASRFYARSSTNQSPVDVAPSFVSVVSSFLDARVCFIKKKSLPRNPHWNEKFRDVLHIILGNVKNEWLFIFSFFFFLPTDRVKKKKKRRNYMILFWKVCGAGNLNLQNREWKVVLV